MSNKQTLIVTTDVKLTLEHDGRFNLKLYAPLTTVEGMVVRDGSRTVGVVYAVAPYYDAVRVSITPAAEWVKYTETFGADRLLVVGAEIGVAGSGSVLELDIAIKKTPRAAALIANASRCLSLMATDNPPPATGKVECFVTVDALVYFHADYGNVLELAAGLDTQLSTKVRCGDEIIGEVAYVEERIGHARVLVNVLTEWYGYAKATEGTARVLTSTFGIVRKYGKELDVDIRAAEPGELDKLMRGPKTQMCVLDPLGLTSNPKPTSTPSSTWAVAGEPDPLGDQYNCARAKLACGDLTDDQLANQVFMHDHRKLDIRAIMAGSPSSIGLLTAAKERIRWLSRQNELLRVQLFEKNVGALNIPKGFKVTPLEPSEALWGGLARQLVAWMRMNTHQTPASLYKHYTRFVGNTLPEWLTEELDGMGGITSEHVIPKGSCAVLIYKAMIHEPLNPNDLPEDFANFLEFFK